jgi:putative membrane protein
MPFLARLLVNAAALWVATQIVPGVTYSGGWLPFLAVAVVFGVINAFIRPVAKILTFPLIILTLGIFALVVSIVSTILSMLVSGKSRDER